MKIDAKALFYQYNPWWEGDYRLDTAIERKAVLAQLYPLLDTPDILIVTGLRRVGKTILMKYLIQYLIEQQGIKHTHCFYISMDDYSLRGQSLLDVITTYRNIMKISHREHIYVFLDEITSVNDFTIQLKNVYDRGQVKCIVSSSSSSVLKDNSACLTGRKRTIEIHPLTFHEYLHFKDITVSVADQGLLDTYFLDYMQTGGMPEYVIRGDREYLVNLIDDILMKDIVAQHGIRNEQTIRDFFVLLMERVGKPISINKVANILSISPDTARRYLTLFEQTYLIYLVPRHGKTNESVLSAKKVYASDVGIRNTVTGFRDKGAIFENLVFMKIKAARPSYVLTAGQEIDFLVNDTLLEVKYQCELVGKQRAAFDAYPAQHKKVITHYTDFEALSICQGITG